VPFLRSFFDSAGFDPAAALFWILRAEATQTMSQNTSPGFPNPPKVAKKSRKGRSKEHERTARPKSDVKNAHLGIQMCNPSKRRFVISRPARKKRQG